ncbi:hypothetical protein TRIP_B330179 [uncultured Desulfatiglans sp.]|nr:hypothetical protein TRIP_B330179 [uncultured Desulfatiglans sp.]
MRKHSAPGPEPILQINAAMGAKIAVSGGWGGTSRDPSSFPADTIYIPTALRYKCADRNVLKHLPVRRPRFPPGNRSPEPQTIMRRHPM